MSRQIIYHSIKSISPVWREEICSVFLVRQAILRSMISLDTTLIGEDSTTSSIGDSASVCDSVSSLISLVALSKIKNVELNAIDAEIAVAKTALASGGRYRSNVLSLEKKFEALTDYQAAVARREIEQCIFNAQFNVPPALQAMQLMPPSSTQMPCVSSPEPSYTNL